MSDLAVAKHGALVDDDTGEILVSEQETADLIESLDTLHRAHQEKTVMELRLRDRLDELQEGDEKLAEIRGQLEQATKAIQRIELSLSEYRPTEDPLRTVSLDTGKVRVTWGKASERWSQKVTPKELMEIDPELARKLGVTRTLTKTPRPRITVRADKE